nr:hypothetical protein [Tanacetum cinerariifolium]
MQPAVYPRHARPTRAMTQDGSPCRTHIVAPRSRKSFGEPQVSGNLRLGRTAEKLPAHGGKTVQHAGLYFQPDRGAGRRNGRAVVRAGFQRRVADTRGLAGARVRRAHHGHDAKHEGGDQGPESGAWADSHRRHGYGDTHLAQCLGNTPDEV